MQNYLKPSRVKLTEEEIQTIFKIRSRGTDVKLNYRGKYENLECRVCKKEEESQKHLHECDEVYQIAGKKLNLKKYLEKI